MKKYLLLPLIAAIAMLGTSCYSTHGSVNAKRSAVVGGIVGAGAGALIGEHKDRELEGAAIGGVLGAVAGGVLGSARDEQYYGQQRPQYRTTQHRTYQHTPPYGTYQNSYHTGYGYTRGYRHQNYYPRHHSSYRPSHRSSSYCR